MDVTPIFRDLARIQEEDGRCRDLLQFRSLVTADQYRRFYRLVEEHVPPGSAVLDWGCGNGHCSYTLSRLGYAVSGFSFEDFGLRQHLGESYAFRKGNAESPELLPYADQSFDAVVSVGVLEHVRETGGNEVASLAEIWRILRPGGFFLCYHFPNRFSWIDAAASCVPNYHRHQYQYTRRDIAGLCQKTGFDLVKVERYGALPRNLWHKPPRVIRNSHRVSSAWNRLDRVLGAVLSPVCQNYLFVAQKPVSSSVRT